MQTILGANGQIGHELAEELKCNFTNWYSKKAREVAERLPRRAFDNLFISDQFKSRSPEFRVTPIDQGLQTIWDGV